MILYICIHQTILQCPDGWLAAAAMMWSYVQYTDATQFDFKRGLLQRDEQTDEWAPNQLWRRAAPPSLQLLVAWLEFPLYFFLHFLRLDFPFFSLFHRPPPTQFLKRNGENSFSNDDTTTFTLLLQQLSSISSRRRQTDGRSHSDIKVKNTQENRERPQKKRQCALHTVLFKSFTKYNK